MLNALFTAIIQYFMPVILELIAFIIAVFIVFLVDKAIKWLKAKIPADKLAYAEHIAQKAYAYLIQFAQTNPAFEKTVECIEATFDLYVAQFLHITPAEAQDLLITIIGDLIKEWDLNPADFAILFEVPASKKTKLLYH